MCRNQNRLIKLFLLIFTVGVAKTELQNNLSVAGNSTTVWFDDEIITELQRKMDLQDNSIKQLIIQMENTIRIFQLETSNWTIKLELLQLKMDKLSESQSKSLTDQESCTTIKIDKPETCQDALKVGGQSGIYRLYPSNDASGYTAYCLLDPDNGTSWTVIQRRQDGSENFYRPWNDYTNGFGNLNGEFFIGLIKLNQMTQVQTNELWIQMENWEGEKRFAKYTNFLIGNQYSYYKLTNLGDYHGNADDSLRYHEEQKFSTYDNNNGRSSVDCAKLRKGGWWYGNTPSCHRSNLNGLYLNGSINSSDNFGVSWDGFRAYYSLKYVHMALRPYIKKNP